MTRLLSLLRRVGLDRAFFTLMYWRGQPPWDTGISPPELVAAVEGKRGEGALPPGRALDIGCGTGTNSLYLARHGWDVTGVDFVAAAIERARRKVRAAEKLPGSVRFLRGDATCLGEMDLGQPFSLLLDLGCLHGIPVEERAGYARGVARWAAPGALYLLYAFGPRLMGGRRMGLMPDEVRALFAGSFTVERMEQGRDPGGNPSAWYWLRRV